MPEPASRRARRAARARRRLRQDRSTRTSGSRSSSTPRRSRSPSPTRSSRTPGPGDQRGSPARQFVGAGTTKLALQLWFDVTAYPDGHRARRRRARAHPAGRLLHHARSSTPQSGGGSAARRGGSGGGQQQPQFAPPAVRFVWGTFQFDGIVDPLEETPRVLLARRPPAARQRVARRCRSRRSRSRSTGARRGRPAARRPAPTPGTTAADAGRRRRDAARAGADGRRRRARGRRSPPPTASRTRCGSSAGQLVDLSARARGEAVDDASSSTSSRSCRRRDRGRRSRSGRRRRPPPNAPDPPAHRATTIERALRTRAERARAAGGGLMADGSQRHGRRGRRSRLGGTGRADAHRGPAAAAASSEDQDGLSSCEATFGNWGPATGGVGFLYFDRDSSTSARSFAVALGRDHALRGTHHRPRGRRSPTARRPR